MGAVMLIAAAPAFASGEGIGGFVQDPPTEAHPGRQIHRQAGRQGDRNGGQRQDRAAGWSSVPAPGKYAVTIDTATIPKGLTLRNIGGSRRCPTSWFRRRGAVCDLPAGAAVAGRPHRPPTPRRSISSRDLTLDGIELGSDHRHGCGRAVADLRRHRTGQLRPGRAGDVRRARRRGGFRPGARDRGCRWCSPASWPLLAGAGAGLHTRARPVSAAAAAAHRQRLADRRDDRSQPRALEPVPDHGRRPSAAVRRVRDPDPGRPGAVHAHAQGLGHRRAWGS